MPLLACSPVGWTGSHLVCVPRGDYPSLLHSDAALLKWSALLQPLQRRVRSSWMQRVSHQGLAFQLWNTTAFFSWGPYLENTGVQMSSLVRLAVVGQHVYLKPVGVGLQGGPWPCWVDSLPSEVNVQPSGCSWCSIVLAGPLLLACLKTNPSTWRLGHGALCLCPLHPCGSPEITESTNHC